MLHRRAPCLSAALACLALALASPSWAQAQPVPSQGQGDGPEAKPEAAPGQAAEPQAPEPEFVVPTEAQFELYREGANAFQAGDYEKARQLFLASLRLGELNVTYLNYGRTLFRLGECQAASQAYAKALTAPRLANPTPVQVLQKVEEYRQELAASCPATLVVECKEPGTQVFIDAMGPLPCDGEPLPVLPGAHTVRGQQGQRKASVQITVAQMERLRVPLALGPAPQAVVIDPEQGGKQEPPPYQPPSLLLGVNLDLLANAPVKASVSNDSTTVNFGTQQEASILGVQLYGAYHLWEGIHLGASGSLFPNYNIEQDGINYLDSTLALDLGGLLLYVFQLETLSPFVLAEGGWSMAQAAQEESHSFQGGHFGGGAGVLWSLGSVVLLRFHVRAHFYELSRELDLSNRIEQRRASVDIIGDSATERLMGQRILVGLGLSFGLF